MAGKIHILLLSKCEWSTYAGSGSCYHCHRGICKHYWQL